MNARDEIGEVPTRSAHERFKSRSRYRSLISFGLAICAHLLILLVWRPVPGPQGGAVQGGEVVMQALRVVTLAEPVESEGPPSVEPAPPAESRVRDTELAPVEDARSAATPPRPPTPPGPPALVIGDDVREVVEEAMAALNTSPAPPIVVPPPPALAEPAEDPGLARFRPITPLMQKPELTNRAQVKRALLREYPRALQRQGVEGAVIVWFWIDEKGRVEKYEIRGSSGHPALDAAAERVIPIMKFRPAKEKGKAIAVVVTLPIRFQVE